MSKENKKEDLFDLLSEVLIFRILGGLCLIIFLLTFTIDGGHDTDEWLNYILLLLTSAIFLVGASISSKLD